MIKFGTSGFRAVIAENFTKENIQKIAYALTKVFKSQDVVPIGYDNRFMGKQFAQWISEVLLAYGKKIKFFEVPVPSPLIAFETLDVELGLMVSASHNPYIYNGIKIFQRGGRELTTQQNTALEKIANKVKLSKIQTKTFDVAIKEKQVQLTKNLTPYINSILKNVDTKLIKNSGLTIYYNAMQGSSFLPAKQIFDKLGLSVNYMNTDVNPNFKFGLPAPYKDNIHDQETLAKKDKFEDFGFALDGDGDRISFVDENGEFYDCNYISAMVYDDILSSGQKCDFVKNCAMTALVDKIAEANNQKVVLAGVGFKNTASKMLENPEALIGAESNGYAVKGHILYKDGLMGALRAIEVLAKHEKPLSKVIKSLKKKYKFPCEVVEYAYPFTDEQRSKINKLLFVDKVLPEIKGRKIEKVSYDDGLKITYENGYWGVLRFSGNENVIRLFAEMENLEECEKTIKVYEKLIGLKTRQV